ncbi:T9SS type B sorting domain-containing protein [Flavobacterium phragmitis]|uniref:Gliding motility-associated C-terminal domain-containing protein n=1 Tax=Flavobacterium phragmitis TaxID=739143 RepID=A0A1I1U3N0_9FLAO|nr:T9SS type B sorting domain-containing protein [Flavobacterium phragmitis]SFD65295.1 gliding motility-associated C-terminal domain-containing protein [Flavobacterium phragmitis]
MKKVFLISFILISFLSFGQENCNNGVDDDGDGKIDLNDEDCTCSASPKTSLVDNHDFELKNDCPSTFAQFSKVENWFLPSTATSDYINSCGFIPVSATDAGVYPFPSRNGNGVAGILISQDYKEFIAACTNTTLKGGTKYQVNFDIAASTSGRDAFNNLPLGQVCNSGKLNGGIVDITIYGRAACNKTIPLNSNKFPPDWVVLGKATYLPSKKWGQLTIEFTPPFDMNSIMLGAPKELSDSYVNEYDYQLCFPYFYIDNVILNQSSDLGLSITSTGSFCENNLVLNAQIDSSIGSGYTYQWYKDGIAIAGETNCTLPISLAVTNTGNYQVKITNPSLCKISPLYNVSEIIDVPEYSIDQSPCFPGITTLTITTPADEYSFDGGITYSTNPSKSGLTASFNPIYISIKKNGCYSNLRNVILTFPPLETISTLPKVNIKQPTCGQNNGSLTVTTPALEYSFDDGITWSTNPVLDNLPPDPHHDYKIRIKTKLGCISNARYAVIYPFLLPMPTVTQTNASCGIGGTISITPSPSYQYSIDNGGTWSTIPFFKNLKADSYAVITKNEIGCISQQRMVYIGTDYTKKPEITSKQPTCGTLGSITVTTSASQYSFDDGISWTNNNTINDLKAGWYIVKVKDDAGCISLGESVYIQSYIFETEINYTFENANCYQNGSIKITTIAKEFSIDNGNTWCSNPLFSNLPAGDYFIKIRNMVNCESIAKYVPLRDLSTTTPSYTIKNAGCNSFGSITITTPADYYSFDNGSTWSENNTISNLNGILNFTLLVKNGTSCFSQPAGITFNSTVLTNPTVNHHHVSICDELNDNAEKVNLTSYASHLINNYSNYTFHYFSSQTDAANLVLANEIKNPINCEVSNNTIIFVAVVSPESCHSVAEINFSLQEPPTFNLIPDTVVLCENETVLVDAGNGFNSYLWSNGATTSSIVINQPGNYSITATSKYDDQICSSTKNFNVILSNRATILKITTQDFNENDNVIEINVSGKGVYEYSLDGVSYQDNSIFRNLSSGIYAVYVRDKNNCGITTDEVFLLMYPKFFTPNGDGFNDTWNIEFAVAEPGLDVSIFDRYGQLIKKLNNTNSWDGTFNGQNLPADDYWFIVKRQNGKEFKSHFSLKR